MVDKDLRKQIRLQDEIDHNLDMGYLPPSEKVRQLKEFEGKTGIMIRNPGKQDRINSECPPGFEFVHAHNKSDGTFVRAFCRKRGINTEIPERFAYRRR